MMTAARDFCVTILQPLLMRRRNSFCWMKLLRTVSYTTRNGRNTSKTISKEGSLRQDKTPDRDTYSSFTAAD